MSAARPAALAPDPAVPGRDVLLDGGIMASPATRATTSSARSACSRRPPTPAAAGSCGASSSSVYGDAAAYPCVEDETPTRPRSPYGVTKRACEDLAAVYRRGGLPTVGLRCF